jgi:hypothetical protein
VVPEPYPSAALSILSCDIASRLGFSITPEEQKWDPEYVRDHLPSGAWGKVQPLLDELRESVPYKINVFECEFLRL